MSQEGTRADDSIPVFVPTDVEFNATHHISPQEAVDVAIPPVLDEAAFALSSSDELSSSDLASMVRDSEDVGSGWSSPALPPTLPHTPRSPVRHSSARSRSPDSRPPAIRLSYPYPMLAHRLDMRQSLRTRLERCRSRPRRRARWTICRAVLRSTRWESRSRRRGGCCLRVMRIC